MSSSEVLAIILLVIVLAMMMMGMAYAMWAVMREDHSGTD